MAKRDDAAEKAESVYTGALVDTESAADELLDADEVLMTSTARDVADDAEDVADQDSEKPAQNGCRTLEV